MAIYSNLGQNLYDINSIISNGVIKLIGAILIILIGVLISKFISKLFKKLITKLRLNEILKKTMKIDVPLEEFVATIIKYLLYLIFLILALKHLGLAEFILNAILIAILSLLVIFIVLTLKDLIPNITAGFLIHHRKLINKGENIIVKDIKGKIIDITLTEVKLETKEKDIIIIPNSILIRNIITKKK
ncbi:MAG: mechanosensitive ion channel [Nanoarchaeota archaeon]|nr:mechanosensitive ion channel [Nanoarchaeota archaeon]MBU0962839.1 mechanosensitive ion channel [Nanoarchaeota archaeon]